MIVLEQLERIESHAARHAEVENHRVAAIGIDKAVFGAAAAGDDGGTGEALAETFGERPAQAVAVEGDAGELVPGPGGGQAAHDGFDFGELRHGLQSSSSRHMARLPCRQGAARGCA